MFDQPDLPAANMFNYLRIWIVFYERNHKKQALDPDDHIFPNISANGTIQPHIAMMHDYVQKLLGDWAESSGVLDTVIGNLTTHGFRRGAAQHRFMEENWRLDLVRWWGGWAQGESVRAHCSQSLRYLILILH